MSMIIFSAAMASNLDITMIEDRNLLATIGHLLEVSFLDYIRTCLYQQGQKEQKVLFQFKEGLDA